MTKERTLAMRWLLGNHGKERAGDDGKEQAGSGVEGLARNDRQKS